MEFNLVTDFDEAYLGGNYGYPFMVRTFTIEVNGQKGGYINQSEYIDMVQDGMPEISTSTRQRDYEEIEMFLFDYGLIERDMFLNSIY